MGIAARVVGIGLALGIGLVYAGCGGAPSTGDVCDHVCSCNDNGCSADERKSCLAGVDDAKKQADVAGCSSEFDDLLSCAQGDSCKDGSLDPNGCKDQSNALEDCERGGGGILGGSVCDKAVQKFEDCTGQMAGSSSGQMVDCTGAAVCQSDCINGADCTAINDAFAGMMTPGATAFINCLSACGSASSGGSGGSSPGGP